MDTRRERSWRFVLFSSLLHNKPAAGLVAVGVEATGIAVLRVARDSARRPTLLACDWHPYAGAGTPFDVLRLLAKRLHLQRAHCTTLLNDTDYKLLATEAPDVPKQELAAALRWRIKDLIDAPIDDITLDTFEIPGSSGTRQGRQVYVVAARNAALRQRIELLTHAGVNIQVVDIVEMAQRNIAALLPQDSNGVAVLSLQSEGGLVTLTRRGELYLSRNLSVGWEHFTDAAQRASAMDQVVLEIQRSLDYYESHFRQAPIRHVVLAPTHGDTTTLGEQLHINLGVEVTQLDLSEFVDVDTHPPDDWQARHFFTFGAALREEATV